MTELDANALKNRKVLEIAHETKWKKFWRENGIGIAFITPWMVLAIAFLIVPVVSAMVISFTNFNMLQPATFVGFNNYKLLLTDDNVFLIAMKNTLIFAGIIAPLGYVMSLMMGWVINEFKFRKGFALAFYAPSIASGAAMSVVWKILFSSDRYGYLNNFLISKLGVISEPILWLNNPETILFVVIFVSVWMGMGAGFLVFMAGFNSVPKSMYEAGDIDGVTSRLQRLWLLTLPNMKPQMLFNVVMAIVGAFGAYDIGAALVGFPSPDYAARTIVGHMYDYAFIRFQMGYASAIAVFLFLLTFSLNRIFMKVFSTKDQ